MASSGTNKRKLPAMINVRMPAALAASVRVHAEKLDITDAAFVRAVVVANIPDADPADATPVKRPQAAPFIPPPEIVHDLDHAREIAAEATGMLKLSAQRYRETGMAEPHAEAEAVLLSMREAATNLLKLHSDITGKWRAYHAGLSK